MDIRKLQRAIVDGLEDVKAQNIRVFNTEHLSPLFERVIIASGASNRQTKALASSVRDAVKSRGMQVLRTEGEDNGEWIIVDCGAAVAHIMQPTIRDYYNLEELWGDKPVRLKSEGPATKGLPKAAEQPLSSAHAAALSPPIGPRGKAAVPAKASKPKGSRAATPRKPASAKTGAGRPSLGASTATTAVLKVGSKAPKAPGVRGARTSSSSPAKTPAKRTRTVMTVTRNTAARKAAPRKTGTTTKR